MIASELEVPDSPLGIAPTRTSQADSQELVAFALGTGHVVAYRPELARALQGRLHLGNEAQRQEGVARSKG